MSIAIDEESNQKAITDLQDVPEDLIHHILSFVSVSSLLTFQLSCKANLKTTNSPSFWAARFRDLVRTKMFIPRNEIIASKRNPKESFKRAYLDRFRTTIEREELVGRVWYFWLKRSAGEEWTCWDPFWLSKGKMCRKMVFLEDGSVLECPNNGHHEVLPSANRQSNITTYPVRSLKDRDRSRDVPSSQSPTNLDGDDISTGAKRLRVENVSVHRRNPSCERHAEDEHPHLSLVRRVEDGSTAVPQVSDDDEVENNRRIIDPSSLRPVFYNEPKVPNNIVMKWRFITNPLDFRPRKEIGGFIRLIVGGREVPTYVVRRLSNGNWGFILESCWGVFSSFDVTNKNTTSTQEDSYMKSFREDPQWNTVNTEIQWKEAMLYNNGANTLPERNL